MKRRTKNSCGFVLLLTLILCFGMQAQPCTESIDWRHHSGFPKPSDLEYSFLNSDQMEFSDQRVVITNVAPIGGAAKINHSIKNGKLGKYLNPYVFSLEGTNTSYLEVDINFYPSVKNMRFKLLDVDQDPTIHWQDSLTINFYFQGKKVNINDVSLDFDPSQVSFNNSESSFKGIAHQSNEFSEEGNVGFGYSGNVDRISITYFYTDAVKVPSPGDQLVGISTISFDSEVSCIRPKADGDTRCISTSNPDIINIDDYVEDMHGLDYGSLRILKQPEFGTAMVNTSTGEITYTANGQFLQADSLDYVICNNIGFCDTATFKFLYVPDNSVSANNDMAVTFKNMPVSGQVLTNDRDVQGDDIHVGRNFITRPSNGKVEFNSNGTYTYTPNTDFFGVDSFGYLTCDINPNWTCEKAKVYVHVLCENPACEALTLATYDHYRTGLARAFMGNVLQNDFHLKGGNMVVDVKPVQLPKYGDLTLYANGDFLYKPNYNGKFADDFKYKVCATYDNCQSCDTAGVKIRTSPDISDCYDINPDLGDDFLATCVNESRSGNLLTNDIEYSKNRRVVIQSPIEQPKNGQVTIKENGDYTYTPNSGYSGSDQFVYEVCFFAQEPQTYSLTRDKSGGVEYIPSNSLIYSSGIYFAHSGHVLDVNIKDLHIEHEDLGDIRVTLTGPNNRVVNLFDHSCPGSSELRISLDDESLYGSPNCPANTGQTLKPVDPLSAYNLSDPKGLWVLSIYKDRPSTSVSALVTWSLEIKADSLQKTGSARATAHMLVYNNSEPIANSDQNATTGHSCVITDVLLNDSDAEGLNVSSLSISKQGKYGIASIVNGKINYCPTDNITAKDTIYYQICDESITCKTSCVESYLVISLSVALAFDQIELQLDYCASDERILSWTWEGGRSFNQFAVYRQLNNSFKEIGKVSYDQSNQWTFVDGESLLSDQVVYKVVALNNNKIVYVSNVVAGAIDLKSALVYPNPFQSEIFFSEALDADVSIKMTDILGRTYKLNHENGKIDVHHLAPGIYSLLIKTPRQTIFKKMVKH